MILDHWEVRIWADHGAEWSDTVTAAQRSLETFGKGAIAMINESYEHLRRLVVVIAALATSAALTGVAILPGAVGLGGAAHYLV